MNSLLVFLLSGILSLQAIDIKQISWDLLADVKFTSKYVPDDGLYFYEPTFGSKITPYQGKEVYITGYMIPIDPEEGFYVLSKSTFANCFFCGASGPETVGELEFQFPGKQKFEMDQKVTVRGYMKFNYDDMYKLNYIMEEASVYK